MRPILITLSLNFLFPPLPILPLHEILTVSRELRSHMKSSGVFGFRERECATCNNADDIRIPAGRAKTFPEEVRTYFFCLGNNGVISIMRWLNRKIEKKIIQEKWVKNDDGWRTKRKEREPKEARVINEQIFLYLKTTKQREPLLRLVRIPDVSDADW